MYLLILYAFLHAGDPREHIVAAHFRTLDECAAMAIKLNKPDPLKSRQEGDVFVCAKIMGTV